VTARLDICWSDESRGLKECRRDDLRAVAWKGGAALGCGKCKLILSEPVAHDGDCEPPDGWRDIPREFLV
jgi:hypothetical protein